MLISSDPVLAAFGTTRSCAYGGGRATPPSGRLPGFAGTAVGCRAVRQYLEQAGTGIVEATLLPADEIDRGSGYFD